MSNRRIPEEKRQELVRLHVNEKYSIAAAARQVQAHQGTAGGWVRNEREVVEALAARFGSIEEAATHRDLDPERVRALWFDGVEHCEPESSTEDRLHRLETENQGLQRVVQQQQHRLVNLERTLAEHLLAHQHNHT